MKTALIFCFLTCFAAMNAQQSNSKILSFDEVKLKEVQKKLDDFSIFWIKEIEKERTEVMALIKTLETGILNSEEKKNLELLIEIKEDAIVSLRQRVFGNKGEIFKKREELLKELMS